MEQRREQRQRQWMRDDGSGVTPRFDCLDCSCGAQLPGEQVSAATLEASALDNKGRKPDFTTCGTDRLANELVCAEIIADG